MLGAAGLGKTYEVSYLAELDRKRGLDVRLARLASLGVTSEALTSQLRMLATDATPTSVIYLDALDEVMVPVKTTGLIIGSWIRDRLAENKPALRISCRSAVWPSNVDAAIREVYGDEDFSLAFLQPVSVDEVRSIVRDRGINGQEFVEAVHRVGATSLAQLPLTLEMLLRVYATHGSLPTSRKELFAQGMELLASERAERWDDGTAIDVPTSTIIEGAERLACLSLFSPGDSVSI